MSHLDETGLRYLAEANGLSSDDSTWTIEELVRWIEIVHEYENRESVKLLTNQLRVKLEAV